MQQRGSESRSTELLVATHNPGKKREYQALLAPLEANISFPDDLGIHLEIREDGLSYAENARKKAESYARASGLLTLADDSGLEVDALEGAPGIHSARYASGSDADRVQALLGELQGIPWGERTARFRCVVTIVTPDGQVYDAEGICEGMIAWQPSGEGGFGYDPVFYLPERGRTIAELSRRTKNRISHRARAVQAALPTLEHLLRESEQPLQQDRAHGRTRDDR
ncbi:MAG: RdgB/HAM1 family non-canonical purine NTP pyrophosphatase [Anaerolineae bacterium]